MATLSDIRTALQTTLADVPGLTVYRYVPDAPIFPALVVTPAESDFNVAFGRGTDTWEFDLYVLVAITEAGIAQDALDEYVAGAGPASIREHVWRHRSLGLPDADAHVARMTAYDARYQTIGIEHVGASLRLIVHTRGT